MKEIVVTKIDVLRDAHILLCKASRETKNNEVEKACAMIGALFDWERGEAYQKLAKRFLKEVRSKEI